jgi:ketosteroid isomerase-like protein
MNIEDLLAREGIRHTLASYNMAGDQQDASGYAAVFTEDGVLDAGEVQFNGREEIQAWKSARAKAPTAEFVRHNLTTCRIELTGPETATARTYFAVITEIGPDHSGYYSDVLRKVGDCWLIAHRKVRLDWRAPDSRFGPAAAR